MKYPLVRNLSPHLFIYSIFYPPPPLAVLSLLENVLLMPLVSRSRYLDHLRKRAAGEVMTTAAWLRHFVTSHPGYHMDSVVTDDIAFDLVMACQEIGLVRGRTNTRWGAVSMLLVCQPGADLAEGRTIEKLSVKTEHAFFLRIRRGERRGRIVI